MEKTNPDTSVLIITNGNGTSTRFAPIEAFTERLNTSDASIHCDYIFVQQLIFAVTKEGISITLEGSELHEQYRMIQLRNIHKFTDYANAIRLYAERYGMELINKADATLPYYGKVSQGFLLTLHHIPTPEFISSVSNEVLLAAVKASNYGYPLVLKHNDGVKGIDNFLVADYETAATNLEGKRRGFMVQPFIPNNGELRVLRFGDTIPPLIFKKRAAPGEYLNNTSQGGQTELVAVDTVAPEILRDATEAARLMGRDIGGVDVLLADNGQYSILEVNTTPALATGAYVEQKAELFQAYISSLKKKVV